jgi:hypothetical protein
MSGDRGFLGRWSRLKQVDREEKEASTIPVEVEEDVQAEERQPVPAEAESPEPAPSEDPAEDLPDIDSLTRDSDYTVFMREGVPQDLQNLALRKLWRSDPVFANLDGLNDYDEDFRMIEGAGEVLRSAWKVGSGYDEPEPEPDSDGEEPDGAEQPVPEVEKHDPERADCDEGDVGAGDAVPDGGKAEA